MTYFVRFLLLSLAFGCHPNATAVLPASNPLPSGCQETRPVIHRVNGVSGTVGYHLTPASFTVSYALPGTIDSQWTGVTCNLPKEYQVTGKRVTFSGEFRDAQRTLTAIFGGQEMYYLYLTAIRPR